MSNLVCIAICILVSFITSAVFITAYREDISDDLNTLRSRLTDAQNKIRMLDDMQYTHNAKIYDLANEVNETIKIIKEMEKIDDGK